MKTMAILSIVAAGLLWVGSAVASTQYYYSANQQIPLYIDSNKITIFFDPEWPYNSEDIIQQYERIDSLIESEIAPDGFKIYALSDPSNLDLFIDTLLMDSRIDFVNPYYILCPNVPSLIGRTFCCKFAENVSQEFIDSLNAANHVQITSENEYAPNQFFMSIQAEALNSTLEIAN